MKTKAQVVNIIAQVAQLYSAQVWWDIEDSSSKFSIEGGVVNPKIFDEITRKCSQETGIDCYFLQCGINSIEIYINTYMDDYYNNEGDYITVGDDDIVAMKEKNDYGTLFK